MSDPPTPLSMERGGKGKTAIPEEEKADEPSILPMTPESKQLAAVIATAVATAMAGRSAPPDSSSSMVRYSAGVSLASRTRSIISIVRNLKLHLVTLPGANLASNELLLKLCKAAGASERCRGTEVNGTTPQRLVSVGLPTPALTCTSTVTVLTYPC